MQVVPPRPRCNRGCASVSTALAQSPHRALEPAPQTVSKGATAIQEAAGADKYLFVFFWKENSQQTGAMWGVFQPAMEGLPTEPNRWPSMCQIRREDAGEQVRRGSFSHAARVGDRPEWSDRQRLSSQVRREAIAASLCQPGYGRLSQSPSSAEARSALGQRRSPYIRQVSLEKGVTDFATDARYAGSTEIVSWTLPIRPRPHFSKTSRSIRGRAAR